MGAGYLMDIGYRDTLDFLVVGFCRDYSKRKEAIATQSCAKRTRMEYEYINRRIEDAAMEIVGTEYEIYINEIGRYVGYAQSAVSDVSESTYKQLKKEVKVNIAKKLHLLD